MMHNKY